MVGVDVLYRWRTLLIQALTELKNIGSTVAARLHEVGIRNRSELQQTGSVKAYKWLSEKYSGTRLPVCYYLYSLEGAIQNRHWSDLSESEKTKLRLAAGLGR